VRVDELAKTVWDYMVLDQEISKSDGIIALGSHDLRIADRAAELYEQGLSPLIVFSGGRGRTTSNWSTTEASLLAGKARNAGIPDAAILLENQSTNTGDNLLFSMRLLVGRAVRTAIIITKPYMERRAWATALKQIPEIKVCVTSPRVSFEDYPNEIISRDEMINVMVSDLRRIKDYPAKGFQVEQEIPDDVWYAYEQLVEAGYHKYL
jgi:uncharacterized SAM-binding protein YcdF (DUF218 family)